MGFSIKYLGHACFLIKSCNGEYILLDPYITKNKDAAVNLEELPKIDAIAVSHGAFDHMGDMAEIALKTGAAIFCGPEVAYNAMAKGIKQEQICQMVWGTNKKFKGIEIRSVEAKHISFFECNGQMISGAPMSFVIKMEDGTGIYFSGDTSIFSDLQLIGKLYPAKIGILCMDGLPGFPVPMSGDEAALAAKLLNVEIAIPMHYPPGSSHPQRFKEILAAERPEIKVIEMKPGSVYQYE